MRPEEQKPAQELDEIRDLPPVNETDASTIADQVKGGETLSNMQKTNSDMQSSTIANLK